MSELMMLTMTMMMMMMMMMMKTDSENLSVSQSIRQSVHCSLAETLEHMQRIVEGTTCMSLPNFMKFDQEIRYVLRENQDSTTTLKDDSFNEK